MERKQQIKEIAKGFIKGKETADFVEKLLVSFGNFLLSENRLSPSKLVTHADLENWKIFFNQGETDEPSVATEAQSIDSPIPPKTESELRDKFFKECTSRYGTFNSSKGHSFHITPEKVFDWFKPYLK